MAELGHTLMLTFPASMDDGQITSVVNYVRVKFGGVEGSVNAPQVATILHGQVDTPPWFIQNARRLAILAIVLAMPIILAVAWAGARTLGHRR